MPIDPRTGGSIEIEDEHAEMFGEARPTKTAEEIEGVEPPGSEARPEAEAKPAEPVAPTAEQTPPVVPVPSQQVVFPAGAEPPKKKYLGRFDTPEELEAHAQHLDRLASERAEGLARMERLLVDRAMGKPGEAPPPATPERPAPAVEPRPVVKPSRGMVEMLNRIALGDEVTDEEAVMVLAEHLTATPKARERLEALADERTKTYVDRSVTERDALTERRTMILEEQASVYTAHPELKGAPTWGLERIAMEEEAKMLKEPEAATRTPREHVRTLFARVVPIARKTFVLAAPETPKPKAPAKIAEPGTFSEGGGGPRGAAPKPLTDQEKELAEIANWS
jgi:hypothetical protein